MLRSIIFDLDDTLYKELDYVYSGFNHISNKINKKTKISKKELFEELISSFHAGENAFKNIKIKFSLRFSIKKMLDEYRNHNPNITLDSQTKNILDQLMQEKVLGGLLTDGRIIQQKNKIKSLGLNHYFENILISEEFGSEKPEINNYRFFMSQENLNNKYYYIGDNTNKDFISPNILGWTTICLLDNGRNIHKQNFNQNSQYLPKHQIKNISDILEIIYE